MIDESDIFQLKKDWKVEANKNRVGTGVVRHRKTLFYKWGNLTDSTIQIYIHTDKH